MNYVKISSHWSQISQISLFNLYDLNTSSHFIIPLGGQPLIALCVAVRENKLYPQTPSLRTNRFSERSTTPGIPGRLINQTDQTNKQLLLLCQVLQRPGTEEILSRLIEPSQEIKVAYQELSTHVQLLPESAAVYCTCCTCTEAQLPSPNHITVQSNYCSLMPPCTSLKRHY